MRDESDAVLMVKIQEMRAVLQRTAGIEAVLRAQLLAIQNESITAKSRLDGLLCRLANNVTVPPRYSP